MFTIRTATRVLFVAVVLAVVGTAQAAEKPKSLVPQGHRVQEELKINPFTILTKPAWDGIKAKPGTAKPDHNGAWGRMPPDFEPVSGKVGMRHGK